MKAKDTYRERNPSIELYIHGQNITNVVTVRNNHVTNCGDIRVQNQLEKAGKFLKNRRNGGEDWESHCPRLIKWRVFR